MTESEAAAYLAGIIDGEGTITIHYHRQHNRRTFALRPRLTIANTCFALLQAVRSRHGGTIISARPQTDVRAECFVWRLCGRSEIVEVLTSVRPFLIVKAAQADLMLRYAEIRAVRGRLGYSDTEMALYQRMRALNQRGFS